MYLSEEKYLSELAPPLDKRDYQVSRVSNEMLILHLDDHDGFVSSISETFLVKKMILTRKGNFVLLKIKIYYAFLYFPIGVFIAWMIDLIMGLGYMRFAQDFMMLFLLYFFLLLIIFILFRHKVKKDITDSITEITSAVDTFSKRPKKKFKIRGSIDAGNVSILDIYNLYRDSKYLTVKMRGEKLYLKLDAEGRNYFNFYLYPLYLYYFHALDTLEIFKLNNRFNLTSTINMKRFLSYAHFFAFIASFLFSLIIVALGEYHNFWAVIFIAFVVTVIYVIYLFCFITSGIFFHLIDKLYLVWKIRKLKRK
ncbi:MAG: hypothetical protein OXB84_01905 [Halobacteriovoraceae bacterium]|nr:hypothetical protein [Halobacteriovoraceae bacterium]